MFPSQFPIEMLDRSLLAPHLSNHMIRDYPLEHVPNKAKLRPVHTKVENWDYNILITVPLEIAKLIILIIIKIIKFDNDNLYISTFFAKIAFPTKNTILLIHFLK